MRQVHCIHQRYRASSPGARTNCCGGRFMCKRPDGYHLDHPVVRGQRHDQATFGAQLRFTDSPAKGRRANCPSVTEVGFCGDSRPTERRLTASVFGSSCDRAEGLRDRGGAAFDPTGSAAHSLGFRARQLVSSGWRLTSTVRQRTTPATVAELLAAASRAYVGTAASGSLCSRPWRKATPSSQMGAPAIDARYLMARRTCQEMILRLGTVRRRCPANEWPKQRLQ